MCTSTKNRAAVSVLVLPLLVFACSSSPTSNNNPPPPPPPPANIPQAATLNGSWSLTILVTTATGACLGEAGQQSTESVNFSVSGSSAPYQVTASGFLGVGGNVLTGTLNAQGLITISGSYPEEGGTTTATHTLQRTSDTAMGGVEAWNWNDGQGGTCPGSTATVTGIKA
jgi:hypothetical protein